ncbi:MAG: type I-F CRISPR-associated protein Csy2 [Halothiobacillus sp.]
MYYLIIPRIKVQRANALATPWAVTLSPVFACTLFTHALGLDTDTQPNAVGIVHHDAQLLTESRMSSKSFGHYPQQFRAATFIDQTDYSSKNKYALSLQPTVSMNIEISLILLFEDKCPSPSKVEASLYQRRIAGGLIIEHGRPVIMESLDEALRAISGGFFLVDRSDEIRSDKGRIESLLSLVNDQPPPGMKRRWLSPAVMGYATLTDFAQRQGAREAMPHAYAEPLVGMIEYHSVGQRKKLELKDNREFPCFWRGKWLADDVFVVKSESLLEIQQETDDE